MKGLEETIGWSRVQVPPSEEEAQLIDLFVEMCFYDIRNPAVIFQFKLVARKLQFEETVIKRIVSLGKSEYEALYAEIEKKWNASFS